MNNRIKTEVKEEKPKKNIKFLFFLYSIKDKKD